MNLRNLAIQFDLTDAGMESLARVADERGPEAPWRRGVGRRGVAVLAAAAVAALVAVAVQTSGSAGVPPQAAFWNEEDGRTVADYSTGIAPDRLADTRFAPIPPSESQRFAATETTITGPASAEAGIVRVRLENLTRAARWMALVDTIAVDRQTYASNDGAIPAAAIVGGRHKVEAGASVDLVVALRPGPYLVIALNDERLAVELATPLRAS